MNAAKVVSALFLYPIKSCAGLSIPHAPFDKYGIALDRNWMLVDPVTGQFMSQRATPRMCLIQPELFNEFLILKAPDMQEYWLPNHLDGEERPVRIWDSNCTGVDQGDEPAEWLSSFLGQQCRLVRIPQDHNRVARKGDTLVGFADAYSALVISQASLDDLNDRLADPIPMNRFRPNIVVSGCEPYAEDHWKSVRIGNLRLEGQTLCARCPIPCTDQATAQRFKEPSATLAKYRRGRHVGRADPDHANEIYFGRNFNHRTAGQIRVGDRVEILGTD